MISVLLLSFHWFVISLEVILIFLQKAPHKSEDGCDATCISESNYTYAIELGILAVVLQYPPSLGLENMWKGIQVISHHHFSPLVFYSFFRTALQYKMYYILSNLKAPQMRFRNTTFYHHKISSFRNANGAGEDCMSNLLVWAKVSYCLLTYFFASYEIVLILPLLELDHAV